MSYLDSPLPCERTARRLLLQAEVVMVSVAIIAMTTAIGLQVFARFFFDMALSWTDEVAVFSFVWVSLIGAAIVIETRSAHLIDYFVKKFPSLVQRIIQASVFILLLFTLFILVKYGIDITEVVNKQRSSILGLRMSFVYGAMPFSAVLMAISILFDWRAYLVPGSKMEEGGA